jgi:hypothetical protein
MELELQGWKVKAALVAVAVVVIAAPFVRATMSNKGRAEDWHRRAVVAEESVTGLRVVIAERSRALNQRTVQANRLVSELRSNGTALRRSKLNVGTLTRRQRELAAANARIESERRMLRVRLATLASIGSKLSACVKGRASAPGKRTVAARQQGCQRVSASFDAYLEQSR